MKETQATIEDFNGGATEHISGLVPAGAADAKKAQGMFYRALRALPDREGFIREELRLVLSAHLNVAQTGLLEDLVQTVGLLALAGGYAESVSRATLA